MLVIVANNDCLMTQCGLCSGEILALPNLVTFARDPGRSEIRIAMNDG
jgi:hypothetical protein